MVYDGLDPASQKLRNFYYGDSSHPPAGQPVAQRPQTVAEFYGLPQRRSATAAGLLSPGRNQPVPLPPGGSLNTRTILPNSAPEAAGVTFGGGETRSAVPGTLEDMVHDKLTGLPELRQSQVLNNARAVAGLLEKDVFPLYALHEASEPRTPFHTFAADPARILKAKRLLIRTAATYKSASCVPDAVRAYLRLSTWCAEQSPAIPMDVPVTPSDLEAYLTWVDATARSTAVKDNARRAAAGVSALDRPVQHRRDGHTALNAARAALKFCVDHFHVRIPIDHDSIERLHVPGLLNTSVPPESVTLAIALAIDAIANSNDGAHSPPVVLFCCSLVALLTCSGRTTQAQSSFLSTLRFETDGFEFFAGETNAKAPTPKGQKLRPFFLATAGLSGKRLWFERLQKHRDVAKGEISWLIFSHDGKNGRDVTVATTTSHSMMSPKDVVYNFREILVLIGVPRDAVKEFCVNSIRRFMPCVARRRGVPYDVADSLGAWGKSAAAQLIPLDMLRNERRGTQVSTRLVSHYSDSEIPVHVRTLLAAQLRAIHVAAATHLLVPRPLTGDAAWSHIPRVSLSELSTLQGLNNINPVVLEEAHRQQAAAQLGDIGDDTAEGGALFS